MRLKFDVLSKTVAMLVVALGAIAPAASYAAPFLLADAATGTTACVRKVAGQPDEERPTVLDATGKLVCKHDLVAFAPGTYTFTLVAKNAAGEVSVASAPFTWVRPPLPAAPINLRLSVM
jgi:hypothetical protein